VGVKASAVEEPLTDEMLGLIKRGEARELGALLLALPEFRRRALMPAFTARARAVDGEWSSWAAGSLAVAGAACLSTAAQVAAWLARPAFRWHHWRYDVVIEVLVAREVPWLADLATRVATALPRENLAGGWRFAAALVRVSGAPVPAHDDFVRGWVENRFVAGVDPVRDTLRADPFLDALLPRIFEVDGLGPSLAGIDALVSLAAEGRISRELLLDGALGRLLRGDRPAALRPFLQLLVQLALTADELDRRRVDLLRLLPDAPLPVATHAQKELRRLDDAGRLPTDELTQASRAVLRRSEKSLVRTQLSWLDAVLRRGADDPGDLLLALSVAVAHDDLAVADRARKTIERRIRECSDPVQARLREAMGERAADRAAASAALGPLPPPTSVPPPIASSAELAAEIVSILDPSTQTGPIAWERMLHALVAQALIAPAELRAALAPLRDRPDTWDGFSDSFDRHWPTIRLTRLLKSIVDGEPWRPKLKVEAGSGPLRVVVARIEELGIHWDSLPAPSLLATPTAATGHVSAAVLVDRLAALEAASREPLRLDLEQALLRLPRERDEEAATRSRSLVSPAGRHLAGCLTGGLPDPAVERFIFAQPDRRWWSGVADTTEVVLASVGPPPTPTWPLAGALLDCQPVSGVSLAIALWPAVAPSHREVIMAHALRSVADGALLDGRDSAAVLPMLAERTGPLGVATALALTYGLACRHRQDQAAAADAVLMLAAAGDLPAGAIGAEVGALCVQGTIKLTRVVAALGDVAVGAPTPAWEIAAAALPALLAAPSPARGTPDLLQLAAKVAPSAGNPPIPAGVADIAARGGSSRLVNEARRLQRVLTSPPTTP
jgi:hypothetical protein